MIRNTAWLLALSLGLATAVTVRADVLDEVDGRYARGEIDEATRHLFRLQAFHEPATLPADLAALPLGPRARDVATAVHVEAAQWLMRSGARGGPVARLLMPEPDRAYILDSATLPIRVTWDSASLSSYAPTVLAAAENSWTIETEDYGFPAPLIESDAVRYRIFIGPTGMGGGAYTAPYAEDESLGWTTCFTYIVVDDANADYPDYTNSTVAHELTHAMQAAVDCAEITPFWENTATYLMGTVYPESVYEMYGVIPEMQRLPWRAIDYMSDDGSDYYEYGGALWAWYLAATFAPSDGPVLLREIWEAGKQSDWGNSVTYLDAIEEVASARQGSALAMADIYPAFAEARYFLGAKDDGAHIANASDCGGCEVDVVKTLTSSSLPVVNDTPPASQLPCEYGSNHIVFSGGGAAPLLVSFDGADDVRWSAEIVQSGGSATEAVPLTLDATTRAGAAIVSMGGHSKLVLVISNLATTAYDPNYRGWTPSTYTYSIEPALPTITAVAPNEIPRGSVNVVMTIHGTSFLSGAGFGVAFDDAGIVVKQLTSVAATEVILVVDVPADVGLGVRDVTVTNRGGGQSTGLDLFAVVVPPDDGCGCRAGGPRSPWAAILLGGLLLAGGRRRRRT